MAGLLIAFGAVAVAASALSALYVATGGNQGDVPPVLSALLLFIQDSIFIATAVALAWLVARPLPAEFGLRPAPFRGAAIATVVGGLAFYGFAAAYSVTVEPSGQQDIIEDLGTAQGDQYLLGTALLVIVLAPVAEEVFFRGFVYRALRNRLPAPTAAGLVGLVFGLMHYAGPDTLDLIPVLVVLGVVFCVLYEWTGSLYPAIALHAFNNAVALATVDGVEDAPLVAASVGVATIAVTARLAGRRRCPTS